MTQVDFQPVIKDHFLNAPNARLGFYTADKAR